MEIRQLVARRFQKLTGRWQLDSDEGAIPPVKGDKSAPDVFVSDRPAELIVTDGQPQHTTVGAAGLEYIEDTESDVFRYERQYYYLVSGRWFRAATLRGPWEHVKDLPGVFATIPADHKKGHVLAAVPDTDEARLAVLEASLPRKATISRAAGKDIQVYYQGEPQFEAIPGTGVERAVNSPNDVLRVGRTYYLCDNAVWYYSETANGLWIVADNIPAEIYSIPHRHSPTMSLTSTFTRVTLTQCQPATPAAILASMSASASRCTAAATTTRLTTAITPTVATPTTHTTTRIPTATAHRPGTTRIPACMAGREASMVRTADTVVDRPTTRRPALTLAAKPSGTTTKLQAGERPITHAPGMALRRIAMRTNTAAGASRWSRTTTNGSKRKASGTVIPARPEFQHLRGH